MKNIEKVVRLCAATDKRRGEMESEELEDWWRSELLQLFPDGVIPEEAMHSLAKHYQSGGAPITVETPAATGSSEPFMSLSHTFAFLFWEIVLT